MWVWGKIATYALRKHIARDLRRYCEKRGISRAATFQASCNMLRKHFDAAWPAGPRAAEIADFKIVGADPTPDAVGAWWHCKNNGGSDYEAYVKLVNAAERTFRGEYIFHDL